MLTSSIIAHRGLWHASRLAPNSDDAFAAAVDAGLGVETDVRDRLGMLVVAHDLPDRVAQGLDVLLDIFSDATVPLAINIKSDGLSEALGAALEAAVTLHLVGKLFDQPQATALAARIDNGWTTRLSRHLIDEEAVFGPDRGNFFGTWWRRHGFRLIQQIGLARP